MEGRKRLVAVVEIGSTGIRLVVAEISGGGAWRVLDRAGRSVALGRDVFTTGQVSRESFLECIAVLRSYQEFLAGWGIAGEDVYLIATSALRVARNRDLFVDRVWQETGFRLTIVEGIEENRLMYLAVRFALKKDFPLFWRANAMILEVGGGSTEIMLLRRGKMVAAHSLKLGTIFIGQASRFNAAVSGIRERFLNENIRNTSEFLSAELDLSRVRVFVVAGADARVAASHAGTPLNDDCALIDREAFIRFSQDLRGVSVEACMDKFRLGFAEAAGLAPGLLVYSYLLQKTRAAQVLVPQISIREGMLIDLARGVDPALQEEFFSQIAASAVNLGRKYHFDEAHCRHVATLSMALFDALSREHGMGRRERVMLEAAALLHDVGRFIKASGHQLHGQYIVANAEIFGLRREEIDVIANVIRYHRGDPPSPTDIEYLALQREERILVLKMAALLRVADALDRGHSQRVRELTVERKSEVLLLHPGENRDWSLEQISLEEKAGLFQEVFGYKVALC